MTYGDEQAEARRLHSILNEGEVMTPQPSIPDDPVATPRAHLAAAIRRSIFHGNETPGHMAERIEAEGYVLVNADMLRDALIRVEDDGGLGVDYTPEHAAEWLIAALQDTVDPVASEPGTCQACGATLQPDETHWSLGPAPMGGYVCPDPKVTP